MEEYACIASVRGARCRNLLKGGRTLCITHEKMSKRGKLAVAPKPERVIVKFRISFELANELQNAGIEYKKIDWKKKEEIHIEQAVKHRRGAYVLRGKEGKADSGVSVFGEKGLSNVSLASIWKELQEQNYKLVNVYLSYPRENSKMRILWVNFLLFGNNKVSSFFIKNSTKEQIKKFFCSTCYEHCYVWVNPPDLISKKVTHTVNLAHILKIPPKIFLAFKEGFWGINR